MANLRILFVHDWTVQQWLGGAQLEIEWMIHVGRRKGHECLLMTPENYDRAEIASADLVVLNNISRFSEQEINWIMKKVPYMRWEHDYSFTQPSRKEFYTNLFQHSLCNIFLSPLHLSEHLKHIPIQNATNIITPSPMNVDLFRDMNLERDMDFLFVGRLSPPKGITNVLLTATANPEKTFHFAGSGPLEKVIETVPNCKLLGEIPNEKMPQIYSRSKVLIHLPVWKEPFGHIVVQAKLCNCCLILNQNIGALSFPWFFSDKDRLRALMKGAPIEAWEKIREIYESSTY